MSKPHQPIYDVIGNGYARQRQADPRWQRQIHAAIGAADSLVNISAGAGSYEPENMRVVAVEPAATMIQQRPLGSAPVVQATAEQLPFPDKAFDVALAILTTHHWSDADQGLQEMRRVARRQVIVTWDADYFAKHFWLVRDYLPQVVAHEKGLATLNKVAAALNPQRIEPLLVPADCADGVFAAHWAKPAAYLNPEVRAAMSGLALIDDDVEAAAMRQLEQDLQDGTWQRNNAALTAQVEADLGYRIVIAESDASTLAKHA